VLENDHNAAHYLRWGERGSLPLYDAQWNDDIHHVLHILLTGAVDGHYADYATRPIGYLGRCLSEGFAYQGEPSPFRNGRPRGEPSHALPPTAFVAFLQNHAQVGNRALGERIHELAQYRPLQAITAILLLAPAPPLLFMGQEFAAAQPFLYFCDFSPALARAITMGRRQHFASFKAFRTPKARATIPDPNDPAAFQRSKLDWRSLGQPPHDAWLSLHRHLLAIRHKEIIPRLTGIPDIQARHEVLGDRGLLVQWTLGDGAVLSLLANLGETTLIDLKLPEGTVLYASEWGLENALAQHGLPPWSVVWFLKAG
jgi:maltooligosyltrehalose trehalohydrolase